MNRLKRIIATVIGTAMMWGLTSCATQAESPKEQIVVRLAAPQNNFIEDFETNWYKLWLEEQTGLKIEMTWLPMEDAEQIARQQLNSGEGLPDAYIGFGSGFGESTDSNALFSNLNLIHYGEKGVILPLEALIEDYGEYTKAVFEEYPEYRLRESMTSADGHIYFMPGYSYSIIKRYRPLMFVNKGWLDTLDMEVPTTTAQFHDMLLAFAAGDPNGNGLADEIPLCGTEAFYSKQPYDFLFNAFIYNDDKNTRLYPVDGQLVFAPVQDEWRDALRYMCALFDEGLYSPLAFTQDDQQMRQMANDSRDILGAFTASNISYTVYQNSPDMMARYVGIAPLCGPEGVSFATVNQPRPKVNAVITSACQNPIEVFELFDLMMSEAGSLYSRFGEKGVDWKEAEPGQIDIYGTEATVSIIRQLYNLPNNKHLQQINPHMTPPEYNMGITWDGTLSDGDYITAQTALLYQDHDPPEYIQFLLYTPEEENAIHQIQVDVEKYIKITIRDFITGARDINDDTAWEAYIEGYSELGLQSYIQAAQTAYDRTRE